MARIDYDEDTDSAEHDESAPWRRRLVTWTLAAIGLGLGFLIPYTLYLNHEVGQRFGQLRWQIPTRVYARPLELATGLTLDANTLKTELDAAAYRDGDGSRPGTYSRNGARWLISSRGFNDVNGVVPGRRVEVVLSGGRVASLRDASRKQALKGARLDPARIATLYGQKQEERRLVRIEEVPELLVTGLQAVEDRDFNSHNGIDVGGMFRAAWVNLRSGAAKQGASTLTQQLARSGLLGIGREQTFTRKGKEILYAMLMEARYDKRTILEAYLNQVYLGQRGSQAIHGVAAASEFWFGRDLRDLNTEQIALLVGIVRGPSHYDPRRNPERATERRNFALSQFHETGLIDDAEYNARLRLRWASPRTQAASPPIDSRPMSTWCAPARPRLPRRRARRGRPQCNERHVTRGAGVCRRRRQPHAQEPGQQAPAVAAGGSRGHRRAQRRSTRGGGWSRLLRPWFQSRGGSPAPGGFAAETVRVPVGAGAAVEVFAVQPRRRFPGHGHARQGQALDPGNSDGRSHGTVRLVDALAMSYNQATVRVGMQVAPERIADLVRTLAGIETDSNPSVILGATDQSPYAMAQLYQFLASGGEIQPLHAVRGVLDASGVAVNRYDKAPAPAQEGDAIAARLITIALQQAVRAGPAANWSEMAWVGCRPPARPAPATTVVTAGLRDTPAITSPWSGSATTRTSRPACTAPPAQCGCGRRSSRACPARP